MMSDIQWYGMLSVKLLKHNISVVAQGTFKHYE